MDFSAHFARKLRKSLANCARDFSGFSAHFERKFCANFAFFSSRFSAGTDYGLTINGHRVICHWAKKPMLVASGAALIYSELL